MTESSAIQAVVAALKYGEDIALATVNSGWDMTSRAGAATVHLYPGAGANVSVTPEVADLLRKSLYALRDLPEDEVGRYGTTSCNLTTIK